MQNKALPFNPYGFFHRDFFIDFFIGINGQPKIRDWADARIYCPKRLLLKTMWKRSWMGETQKNTEVIIFTSLRSTADCGGGLILLLSALFSKRWARRKVGNIIQISMSLVGHGVREMSSGSETIKDFKVQTKELLWDLRNGLQTVCLCMFYLYQRLQWQCFIMLIIISVKGIRKHK